MSSSYNVFYYTVFTVNPEEPFKLSFWTQALRHHRIFLKISATFSVQIGISCYEFRLHNNFAENCVTRGLSPLPVCVLDKEQLNLDNG